MTQPTSVNMTFDTSLVDLAPESHRYDQSPRINTSFSTTESDPSDVGPYLAQGTPITQQTGLNQTTPTPSQITSIPKTSTPVQHIPTQEAYNQWASIYDSDGNMLQSMDDIEIEWLLPTLLARVLITQSGSLNLLDLGCGTGRNTAKLLSYAWPKDRKVNIVALDFSEGMLNIAAKKLTSIPRDAANVTLRLEKCDCFPTVHDPSASPLPAVQNLQLVDAITSTLVLEHIPLRDYFSTLASLVVKDGLALVTNMHSEMGRISQAGFINEQGVKVRGESYAYTPEETVEEAKKAGFEVLELKERKMEKRDVESGLVGERGLKWVGINVWYGLLLKKIV
ncbi:S-adenosyl-L-methionine-dependent methyltransferase [Dendryphion nanum]|uniref:S-adenosyl-L-methionine-dependent methyltransferase n=1 Tax=Dendryphion nanum TaxID=256645 RepID=A0A9P9IA82_9PLEO|nr:S-adenosyl-L-methionine-dependent methyltransferase [Dendryphion nanum]